MDFNLTLLDLLIIIDTLQGSLRIKDNDSVIFKYIRDAREELMNKLYKQAKDLNLNYKMEE